MTNSRPSLSDRDRARLFKLHSGICHICGEKIDGTREAWDVEHVIPRNLLGRLADTDENMQPAHRKVCHSEKSKRDAKNFAQAVRREHRHMGAHQASKPLQGGKPLPGANPAKRASSPLTKTLPPRRGPYVSETGR